MIAPALSSGTAALLEREPRRSLEEIRAEIRATLPPARAGGAFTQCNPTTEETKP